MPPPRRKSAQVEVEEQVDWAPKIELKAPVSDMRAVLEKLKSRDGILGYIIRGPSSASVDIKDPAKIIDYAALSAEATETSENMSEAFDLGKIENVVVESARIKILSFKKDDQQISIFMEKTYDHDSLLKELG